MDDAQALMSHVGCYQWRKIYSLISRDTNPFQVTRSRTQCLSPYRISIIKTNRWNLCGGMQIKVRLSVCMP